MPRMIVGFAFYPNIFCAGRRELFKDLIGVTRHGPLNYRAWSSRDFQSLRCWHRHREKSRHGALLNGKFGNGHGKRRAARQ